MTERIPENLRSKILWRVQEQCLKLLDKDAPRDNGNKPSRDFTKVSSEFLNSLRNDDERNNYKLQSASKGDIIKYSSLSSAKRGEIAQYGTVWIRRHLLTDIDSITRIGSNIGVSNNFPDSPSSNDIIIFDEAVASGLDNYRYGSITIDFSVKGEIAQFDGTNWQRRGNLTDFDNISMIEGVSDDNNLPSDSDSSENDIFIFNSDSSDLTNYRDNLKYTKIELLSNILGSKYFNSNSTISLFPAVFGVNTILIFGERIDSIENYTDVRGKRLLTANKGDFATINSDHSSWIKRGNIYNELGSKFKDGSIYVSNSFDELIDLDSPLNYGKSQPVFAENDLFIFNNDVSDDDNLPEYYDGTVKMTPWDTFNQLNSANEYEYWYEDPNTKDSDRLLSPLEEMERRLTSASQYEVAQFNQGEGKWYRKGIFGDHLILSDLDGYDLKLGTIFPSNPSDNQVFIFESAIPSGLEHYYIKNYPSVLNPRIIRLVRVGSVELQGLIGDREIFNESNAKWLPAIIIETGSDEHLLTSSYDTRTTPLDSDPSLMIVNIRLILLAPTHSELMKLSRPDQFDISNSVRITHIRESLNYLLNPSIFLNLTYRDPAYKAPFRVKDARITQSYNLEGKVSPFEINDFRLYVKFDQPIFII